MATTKVSATAGRLIPLDDLLVTIVVVGAAARFVQPDATTIPLNRLPQAIQSLFQNMIRFLSDFGVRRLDAALAAELLGDMRPGLKES